MATLTGSIGSAVQWRGELPNLTPPPAFAKLEELPLAQTASCIYRAEVAELADARGSGPRTRKGVGVRVPSSAPKFFSPGFRGFLVYGRF